MKKSPTLLVLIAAATFSIASAVPMSSLNYSTTTQSAPSGAQSSTAMDSTGVDRPKIQYFLVSASVTVDGNGSPTAVKLVNPTDDNWVNDKVLYQLRHRRYVQPQANPAQKAGTFTVVTRVQVTN